MKFVVSAELLQKIVNYLVARPFSEVHGLVNEIGQLKAATDLPAPAPAPASSPDSSGPSSN
jgi:hypothetical protein